MFNAGIATCSEHLDHNLLRITVGGEESAVVKVVPKMKRDDLFRCSCKKPAVWYLVQMENGNDNHSR